MKLFSYKKLWNSFISRPFLRNGLLEIFVELVPCRESRRPCSIDSFPASQVEAITVEILLSSQGSRKVNVENHPSCIRSWPVLITFEPSESSMEVHPGSIEAFAKLLFVAIANIECCTLSFSCSSPHHGQFFRQLNFIVISVTTVRRCGTTPPSFSATVLTTLRPHGLTLSSSVSSTPDTRLVK
jgi:hypothetical protein